MGYTIEWHGDDHEAKSPEEAARNILDMIRNSEGGCHIFYVRDESTGTRYRVDLGTEEDREGEPVVREMTAEETARAGMPRATLTPAAEDIPRLLKVTWYNSTTDTAGEYLTRSMADALAHKAACERQGSTVEIHHAQ